MRITWRDVSLSDEKEYCEAVVSRSTLCSITCVFIAVQAFGGSGLDATNGSAVKANHDVSAAVSSQQLNMQTRSDSYATQNARGLLENSQDDTSEEPTATIL